MGTQSMRSRYWKTAMRLLFSDSLMRSKQSIPKPSTAPVAAEVEANSSYQINPEFASTISAARVLKQSKRSRPSFSQRLTARSMIG